MKAFIVIGFFLLMAGNAFAQRVECELTLIPTGGDVKNCGKKTFDISTAPWVGGSYENCQTSVWFHASAGGTCELYLQGTSNLPGYPNPWDAYGTIEYTCSQLPQSLRLTAGGPNVALTVTCKKL